MGVGDGGIGVCVGTGVEVGTVVGVVLICDTPLPIDIEVGIKVDDDLPRIEPIAIPDTRTNKPLITNKLAEAAITNSHFLNCRNALTPRLRPQNLQNYSPFSIVLPQE